MVHKLYEIMAYMSVYRRRRNLEYPFALMNVMLHGTQKTQPTALCPSAPCNSSIYGLLCFTSLDYIIGTSMWMFTDKQISGNKIWVMLSLIRVIELSH